MPWGEEQGELVIVFEARVPASGGYLRKFHWATGAGDDKKQVLLSSHYGPLG